MESNKDRLILGAKVAGIFVWALSVIATCSAVWNAHSPATIGIAAGITMLTSGYCIYKAWKKNVD